MPLSFTRLLLALALALTVPVQGFAAVTAGLCMALGHHNTAGHAHDGDTEEHPQHDHDSAPSGTHCAPCVACCAAAAIGLSVPLLVVDERADSVVAAEPLSFAGIALDTLDRPPLPL